MPDPTQDPDTARKLAYFEDLAAGRLAELEIMAGAGGAESQDWCGMLLLMYERWAERRGFGIEVLSLISGASGAPILAKNVRSGPSWGLVKSCHLLICGEGVRELLAQEAGVHRLVRVSPHDPEGRRHTSFAIVQTEPKTVRSYILHPYTRVKDERTGVETENAAAVLNGDLDLVLGIELRGPAPGGA